MGMPTKSEALRVSRTIPDEPGTVTFDVERTVVNVGDGERVLVEAWRSAFTPGEIVRTERRTITITTTPWAPVQRNRSE